MRRPIPRIPKAERVGSGKVRAAPPHLLAMTAFVSKGCAICAISTGSYISKLKHFNIQSKLLQNCHSQEPSHQGTALLSHTVIWEMVSSIVSLPTSASYSQAWGRKRHPGDSVDCIPCHGGHEGLAWSEYHGPRLKLVLLVLGIQFSLQVPRS